MDYTKILFGEHACHVPAWMVVQDGADGFVSFVGGSKMKPGEQHPLCFGATETHKLIVGELVVRPHRVTASNVQQGSGLAGVAIDPFPILEQGRRILDLTHGS